MVITPFDFTRERTHATMDEIRAYNNYIHSLLTEYLEGMNVGLSFYGIEPRLNEKSNHQIDFYDTTVKPSKFITSCKFQCPNNKAKLMGYYMLASINQINMDFDTTRGKVSVTVSGTRDPGRYSYHFNLTENGVIKTIEFTGSENGYDSAKVAILGHEDFGEKTIDIMSMGNYQVFEVAYNDYDGPYRNKKEGAGPKRRVRYDFLFNSPNNCSISAKYYEVYGRYIHEIGKCRSITTEYQDYREKSGTPNSVRVAKFNKALSRVPAVMAHPRTKETINKAEEEFNAEIPGIIDFFRRNFDLYNYMTSCENVRDPEFDKVEFLDECDYQKQLIA